MVVKRLLHSYTRQYRAFPLTMAFVTCYVKGSASDVVAQCSLEGKPFSQVDWARNIRFSMFSGVYCGMGCHYIYNIFYPRFVSNATSVLKTAIKKVTLDNLIHVPFLYFPLYYTSKHLMMTGKPESITNGLEQYYNEAEASLIAYWKVS